MRIPPVVRFVLPCCLFAGWIGWLGWMAATTKQTVLSRPQLLVSEMDVVAEVAALDQPIVVKEVLAGAARDAAVVSGASLRVGNLAECKRLPREGEDADDVPLDWTGPGLYLLPLRATTNGQTYLVAETPPSPGYPPRGSGSKGSPRIYHATSDVLRQYAEIHGTP